jgi:hypothetical protein
MRAESVDEVGRSGVVWMLCAVSSVLWSRDLEAVLYGVWAQYLHLLCNGVEPGARIDQGRVMSLAIVKCAPIWESRDRGT